MTNLIQILLDSGVSAVNVALYTLLPVLVVMMVAVRLLEITGVLPGIEHRLERPLAYVGLPSAGCVAMVQLLFVNFAAPVESMTRMTRQGEAERGVAATLAMVLAMAQANVTFPLMTDGLSPWSIPIALVGGLAASFSTYYWFGRSLSAQPRPRSSEADDDREAEDRDWMSRLIQAGEEGVRAALTAIPFLILGFGLVNTLRLIGASPVIESALSSLLAAGGLSEAAAEPIITKYLAGGTAMMGVTHDLIASGTMSGQDLNRIAGFTINPFDPVGVFVLIGPLSKALGKRAWAILFRASFGVAVGVVIRAALHFALF